MRLLLLPLLLAGCAVGPDYHSPAPPAVQGYTVNKLPAQLISDQTSVNPTQNLVTGMDVQGDWWELFRSKPLSDLIAYALAHNHDLKAAQAALRQARENVYSQEGNFLPSFSGSFQPSRNKTATGSVSPVANTSNPYYSLYTAQLNVSYNPDVFGLNVRETESLVALADAQKFQLEATYLTLTSNVVNAAIGEASLRSQIAATLDIIKVERALLVILNKQFSLGAVARVDVLAQEAQVAQAEASLPPLQKQLAQQRDQIATLSGRFPSEAVPETFSFDDLQIPLDLPVSLPADLVKQRPDVQQADANVHSASAQIGVAVANRLPVINLSAFGGSESLKVGDLFSPGNGFWTLAGSLTAPIFDGGILLHKERGARAAFQQALETYQTTVIQAFQTVADTLQALQADSDAVRVATLAVKAADATLAITGQQLRLGQISYLAFLSAEQVALQARLTAVQARATRLSDTAGLFQALGGGWWHRADVQVKDIHGDDILGVVGLH